MNPEQLMKFLKGEGYQNLRPLEDGTIVGTYELAFTRALVVGLTEHSWERRYCYDEPDLALHELAKLQKYADEPSGWIAKR